MCTLLFQLKQENDVKFKNFGLLFLLSSVGEKRRFSEEGKDDDGELPKQDKTDSSPCSAMLRITQVR